MTNKNAEVDSWKEKESDASKRAKMLQEDLNAVNVVRADIEGRLREAEKMVDELKSRDFIQRPGNY